jgi:alkanesulfonate monooxygenase SsuD/methylene tetrahydromethanopterin reductase-like flavin-dependent oxidoreductase (luciferase family)
MIAPTDERAAEQGFGDQASCRYNFTYMRQVFFWQKFLIVVKPDPDMDDEETTAEAITEECVIYGSPNTVLDKLIAFRDHVGPFGTLLLTTADWGGPNRAWEQHSMRALAEDVMPKFSQHVDATAAA